MHIHVGYCHKHWQKLYDPEVYRDLNITVDGLNFMGYQFCGFRWGSDLGIQYPGNGNFLYKLWKNETCVCETQMPPVATKSNYGKTLKSHILILPHPKGYVMSVKSEQPLDKLTVQVWLLYDHSNFKYCTLFISGTELYRMENRLTDNTRCPQGTFQVGGGGGGGRVRVKNYGHEFEPQECVIFVQSTKIKPLSV